MSKIDTLIEQEGLTLDEFMEEFGLESVVPGICMNDGCDYTTNVEPDSTEGWCENCETNTVRSGVVLLGII